MTKVEYVLSLPSGLSLTPALQCITIIVGVIQILISGFLAFIVSGRSMTTPFLIREANSLVISFPPSGQGVAMPPVGGVGRGNGGWGPPGGKVPSSGGTKRAELILGWMKKVWMAQARPTPRRPAVATVEPRPMKVEGAVRAPMNEDKEAAAPPRAEPRPERAAPRPPAALIPQPTSPPITPPIKAPNGPPTINPIPAPSPAKPRMFVKLLMAAKSFPNNIFPKKNRPPRVRPMVLRFCQINLPMSPRVERSIMAPAIWPTTGTAWARRTAVPLPIKATPIFLAASVTPFLASQAPALAKPDLIWVPAQVLTGLIIVLLIAEPMARKGAARNDGVWRTALPAELMKLKKELIGPDWTRRPETKAEPELPSDPSGGIRPRL